MEAPSLFNNLFYRKDKQYKGLIVREEEELNIPIAANYIYIRLFIIGKFEARVIRRIQYPIAGFG